MKTLIIGDIHGCFREMTELIDRAGLSDGDDIIALGDVIDRGPDSWSVVNFFLSQSHASTLLGNHEEKHIRIFSGRDKPAPAQEKFREQVSSERYERVIRHFECLPVFIDRPDVLLIHGLLEPGIAPGNQKKNVLIGSMSGEIYMKKNYPKPWYTYYQGAKPVIAGHHDYSGAGKPCILNDKVYLIDTGCCYGRSLTGLLLPDFRIVSVKSNKNYWGQAMQSNKKMRDRALGDTGPHQ